MKQLIDLKNVKALSKMEQKTINGGTETCSDAYDRCDTEYPDDFNAFNYCMHVAAACD